MKGRVWTPGRKWMGNLIPLVVWLPLTVAGVLWMVGHSVILGLGLWLIVLGQVLAWLALNAFGFYANARMRREIDREVNAMEEPPVGERYFVGIATPKHKSLLDAHEDVGFLYLLPEKLEFLGDSRHIHLLRRHTRRISFRANVHTFVGLGRWIAVDGEIEGKPVRLLIEPRERKSLLGNLRFGKRLRRSLEAWLAGNAKSPPVKPGGSSVSEATLTE